MNHGYKDRKATEEHGRSLNQKHLRDLDSLPTWTLFLLKVGLQAFEGNFHHPHPLSLNIPLDWYIPVFCVQSQGRVRSVHLVAAAKLLIFS
jgi:hypothetical protein